MTLTGIQKSRLKKCLQNQEITNDMKRQDIYLETLVNLLDEKTRNNLIKVIK